MITDKAREIRKRLDLETQGDRPASHRTSEEIWAELFEHCNPTEEELDEMVSGAWFRAGHIHHMIFKGFKG